MACRARSCRWRGGLDTLHQSVWSVGSVGSSPTGGTEASFYLSFGCAAFTREASSRSASSNAPFRYEPRVGTLVCLSLSLPFSRFSIHLSRLPWIFHSTVGTVSSSSFLDTRQEIDRKRPFVAVAVRRLVVHHRAADRSSRIPGVTLGGPFNTPRRYRKGILLRARVARYYYYR